MTEKWGENQEKLDLVRVSGKFHFSEFKLSGLYPYNVYNILVYIYII